jgi:hypothetical protein
MTEEINESEESESDDSEIESPETDTESEDEYLAEKERLKREKEMTEYTRTEKIHEIITEKTTEKITETYTEREIVTKPDLIERSNYIIKSNKFRELHTWMTDIDDKTMKKLDEYLIKYADRKEIEYLRCCLLAYPMKKIEYTDKNLNWMNLWDSCIENRELVSFAQKISSTPGALIYTGLLYLKYKYRQKKTPINYWKHFGTYLSLGMFNRIQSDKNEHYFDDTPLDRVFPRPYEIKKKVWKKVVQPVNCAVQPVNCAVQPVNCAVQPVNCDSKNKTCKLSENQDLQDDESALSSSLSSSLSERETEDSLSYVKKLFGVSLGYRVVSRGYTR